MNQTPVANVQPITVPKISPRKRPDVMQGSTYKVTTAYGNLYVTINEDEHGPFEVFSQLGKAGGFFGAQTEAICRIVSLALRSGISINDVVDQSHENQVYRLDVVQNLKPTFIHAG